ncbi:MAG: hypothetical protein MJ237_09625 [bacterium]|nr:hypothetical protein [bacterium]
MTKLEKNEKKKEVAQQNKEFFGRLAELFEKKYRYSIRYEDSLIADDGKAYVNVDLTKIDSPFSVFSYDKRIDPEIYDYIDKQVYYLRAAIPVVINFDDGGKYSEELKDKIRKNVIRHYSLEYEDKRLEHRKSLFFALILFLIGLFFLGLHFISIVLFENAEIDARALEEISLILSWMFIWQSADFFIVSGHNKRVEIYNSGQLALAEVTFGTPKTIINK